MHHLCKILSFGELFSFLNGNFCLLQPVYNAKNSFTHCIPFVKSKQNSNSAVGTWILPWIIMNCMTNYVAMISYCNFVLRENIGNYLRSHFYMPHDWLKNNQSRAAISTSAVPRHVSAFFKLTSLFPFDANDITRNLDCWRSRRQQVARYIQGQSSHERLYAHGDLKFSFFKPLNLYGPASKTTWNRKNCYQDECYS